MDAVPDEGACLTYLDVLDEEDREFSGTTLEPVNDLRQAYADARRKLAALASNDPAMSAEKAVVDTEHAYRIDLFKRLHQRKRSALCFSGGGIRSSTFALGIMQGLATCSRRTRDGERPELLGELDYLSTVSGGGYLGAWFSSWAARFGREASEESQVCEASDGPARVMEQLAKSPDSTFEPEPPEVHHLREYSNYLAPRRGVFSADTWTLISHVLRNIFLNWLVLIPLFAAGLLLPILAWRLLWLQPGRVAPETLWYLVIAAFLFGAFSVGYVGYDLPNAGNARRSASRFLVMCLLPLSLAAAHLNIFWAWLPRGGTGEWWDLVHLGKNGLAWWHFAVFGSAMHGGGMLLGIGYAIVRLRRPAPHIGLAATAAAAVTGFMGGIAGRIVTLVVPLTADGHIAHPRVYAVLGFPAVIVIFLFAQTLLVGTGSYITEDEDREWWARCGGWLIAVGASWLGFSYLVLYSVKNIEWANAKVSAAFTMATGLSGWAASKAGKSADTSSGRSENSDEKTGSGLWSNTKVKEYGARLLLPVFVILLTMLLGACDINLVHLVDKAPDVVASFWPEPMAALGNITSHALWVVAAELLLCAVASYFININKFSLHGMYRLRLIRAFLGGSNTKRTPNLFTGFDEKDNLSMRHLSPYRPMHIVNMALNLVHGKNLAWQQRKAESFTASRLHTGSCRVGYRSSQTYGGRYRKSKRPISLGTAITISGAAASPNMGYHSSPLLTLVMTLFNARLGWWLGNPKWGPEVWQRPGPRLGIRPFINEAFGLTDDQAKWLYLSDGGHFENLGIYEMVLRRVHLIIACDGSADPGYAYEDLANAVRKVRVDMGIPIEFGRPIMPMAPEHKPTSEFLGHHCAVGRIRYSVVDSGADDGVILYIKTSLNGNETADIQHYAATHISFPQEPTLEQFYDEAQFESYRRLGLHIIEEICGSAFNDGLSLNGFVERARNYCDGGVPATLVVTKPDPEKEPERTAAALAAVL